MTLDEDVEKLDRVYPRECFINAAPDGQYALRILRHYREKCNTMISDNAEGENTNPLYDIMNQHQAERAAELDKAIKILSEASK